MADARAPKGQAAQLFTWGRFDEAAAICTELCELEP